MKFSHKKLFGKSFHRRFLGKKFHGRLLEKFSQKAFSNHKNTSLGYIGKSSCRLYLKNFSCFVS